MVLWLAIIGVLMAFGFARNERIYLFGTGGRYLLTGLDCLDQTGHVDIELRDGRSSAVFVPMFQSKVTCVLVRPVPHTHLIYQLAKKL